MSAEPQLRAAFWEVATPGLQATCRAPGCRDNPQGPGLRPGGSRYGVQGWALHRTALWPSERISVTEAQGTSI